MINKINLSRTIVTLRERVSHLHFSSPEIFVLVTLFILGIFTSWLIPLDAGFDEENHLIRIWEISALQFIPNDKLGPELPFPAIYSRMSIRKEAWGEIMGINFWSRNSQLPLDTYDYIYGRLDTTLYTPPLYLPQALVMRYLGRRMGLPALPIYLICRLAGLLSYTLLAWLAVRLIPFGKWVFAITAVSPMALFQASTITPDSISNGLGLLFIGGCLAIAKRDEIRWKEWGILVFLIFLLFLAKINLIFLVLLPFLLLLPSSRFKFKGGYGLLAVAALILLLIEVGGWNMLVSSRYIGTLRALPGSDYKEQVLFILAHPLDFVQTVLKDLWINGILYLRQWMGIYGYGFWIAPSIVHLLYSIGLVLALFLRSGDGEPRMKLRLKFLIIFTLSYLATVGSIYLFFVPVGSPDIPGVVGRYFIPVMPLLILSVIALPWVKRLLVPLWLIVSLIITSLICFTLGLFLSYYVPCGRNYYQLGVCYQPSYKRWTPNASYSPMLSREMTLTQSFVPVCNGMTEIRVWVDASGTAINDNTEFTFRVPEQNLTLVKKSVQTDKLPHQGWFTLEIDPDWGSAGKLYALSVRVDTSHGGTGPRIAYNPAPVNTVGELSINGQDVDQNLVYQYGCVTGLEKIWWNIHHGK